MLININIRKAHPVEAVPTPFNEPNTRHIFLLIQQSNESISGPLCTDVDRHSLAYPTIPTIAFFLTRVLINRKKYTRVSFSKYSNGSGGFAILIIQLRRFGLNSLQLN